MLTRAISLPVNCKFIYAINYCLGGLNKALTCGVKDALLGPWVIMGLLILIALNCFCVMFLNKKDQTVAVVNCFGV